MGLKVQPPAGTMVRLTAKFLASTGQQTGSAGLDRWTVVRCESGGIDGYDKGSPCSLCRSGTTVATNEKHSAVDSPKGYEDLDPADRLLMKKHIHIGNLEIVGAPPKAEDYDIPVVKRY